MSACLEGTASPFPFVVTLYWSRFSDDAEAGRAPPYDDDVLLPPRLFWCFDVSQNIHPGEKSFDAMLKKNKERASYEEMRRNSSRSIPLHATEGRNLSGMELPPFVNMGDEESHGFDGDTDRSIDRSDRNETDPFPRDGARPEEGQRRRVRQRRKMPAFPGR